MRTPKVTRYRIHIAEWPAGVPAVRLAFLSDTHVAGPDMPPARLARIVAQVNALRPDCVLLGGDYVSRKPFATRTYSYAEAVAPFARLRPRLATIGVDGNHDEGLDADHRDIASALRRAGVTLLVNSATKCGTLTVAGVPDYYGGRAYAPAAAAAAAALGGPAMLLSHAPDPFAYPDADRFALTIAGHTHCGQIALPWYGAVISATRFGRRYACGLVRERGRVLIVGAGLGTSGVPLRLFTRPEIVLVEAGG